MEPLSVLKKTMQREPGDWRTSSCAPGFGKKPREKQFQRLPEGVEEDKVRSRGWKWEGARRTLRIAAL